MLYVDKMKDNRHVLGICRLSVYKKDPAHRMSAGPEYYQVRRKPGVLPIRKGSQVGSRRAIMYIYNITSHISLSREKV